MLQIRKQQLHILGHARLEQFVLGVVEYLRTAYPLFLECRTQEEIRAFVDRVVEAGSGFGITTRRALTTLAELSVEFGESFERSPDRSWALGILEQKSLPGELKADVLSRRMRARTAGRVVVSAD